MTFPVLPAQGSTSWFAWAQAVHNNVNAATTVGLSVLNAADAPTARQAIGALADTYAPSLADAPAQTVIFVVQNGDGTWPNRPTARTDLLCLWIRIVANSADPTAATSPAVTGAYTNDLVMGA